MPSKNNHHSTNTQVWPQQASQLANWCRYKGFDAVLLQDGHQMYFVSKSIQPYWKAYVAVELGSVAESWATEKSYHFLFGKSLKQIQTHLKCTCQDSDTTNTKVQGLIDDTFPYDLSVKYIKWSNNQLVGFSLWLGPFDDRVKSKSIKNQQPPNHCM